LKRAGVPGGTILAFALAAPLLNPISILYGLTLSEPFVIFCFILGTLVVSTVAGLVWDFLFTRPEDLTLDAASPPMTPGLKRMASVAVAAGRELTGPSLIFIGIGLAGVILLALALPYGFLQHTMKHDDPLSPLLMAPVALFSYASPMKVMMQLGLMFEHGNSVGAAYVLLVLGAGCNLGTIAWSAHTYGWNRTLIWFTLVIGLAIGLGYVSEYPLFFPHEIIEHSHAFDDYAAPFAPGTTNAESLVLPKLSDSAQAFEVVSLIALTALILLGLLTRLLAKRLPLEAWLEKPELPRTKPAAFWDRPLSSRTLGLVGIAALIVFSVIGCYIYYPDSPELFEDMSRTKTSVHGPMNQLWLNRLQPVLMQLNAVTQVDPYISLPNIVHDDGEGHRVPSPLYPPEPSQVWKFNKEEVIRQVRRWDDLTRKLQVSVYMRRGQVSEEQTKTAEDLREKLEELRDALRDDDIQTALKHNKDLEPLYRACRKAYLPSTD
jgi:hypothetical protein